MALTRSKIVEKALVLLDTYGLPDLTMRRLSKELSVAPGALYWHFPNKQALLGAVADEILTTMPEVDPKEHPQSGCRGDHQPNLTANLTTAPETAAPETAAPYNPDTTTARICPSTQPHTPESHSLQSSSAQPLMTLARAMRESLLIHRDGAELVAASFATQTLSRGLREQFSTACLTLGLCPDEAKIASDTLLFFILGYTVDEQARRELTALTREKSENSITHSYSPPRNLHNSPPFEFGLQTFVLGIMAQVNHQRGHKNHS